VSKGEIFSIKALGECKIKSPIPFSKIYGDSIANFVNEEERILYKVEMKAGEQKGPYEADELMEQAGPREQIYFNSGHVHAGIVTCGGICPGLNDVIRAIVRTLWYRYGIKRISGVQYGYRGFEAQYQLPLKELNPDNVDDIHNMGGTILGSSRGGGDPMDIVDALERLNMNILFTIGGDGTHRGSLEITEEIEKRGLKIAVVGIPKTIDNDLNFVRKTFGFETAVAKAVEAVSAAHTEAKSAFNGLGLVKVMGRDSGFIATHTTLATSDVNFALIPEVPFDLEGPNGLFHHLEARLKKRHHAVVLVAEGAGLEHMEARNEKDASGNKKMQDIGLFLKEKLGEYFKSKGMDAPLKYIDPSYMIRAAAATPNDSLYCARLGANAVHAAMAGKTALLIGLWHSSFVHIPIGIAIKERKRVDPEGSLWRDLLETTRQPIVMRNEKKK